jgi:PAS domain S-box-containing protein
VPAFAVNGQRRLGFALAIGVGCVVALGAAASVIFGQVGADWLRLSLIAQVIVVAALALVLAHQIVALRRTQGSLVAANTDLAGAQASLETNNRMLRATQAELKRARQQLIDGLEGSADGFALYDAEDRLVVCNSRYRDLFGLHPDLLRPGTPFVDILRAHISAGRVAAAIGREEEWIAARLAQHRDPQGLFERNIDGHWFRFSDRPTSEGGTVTIFTQIDELKQREQRLRENQSILQSILDHIPVTVSITDRERRIVLLNRRIEDLYGVHQAEVVGRPIDEVRPRRYSSDSAVRDHFRVIETGEPVLGREDDYADGRDTESWITSVVPIKGEDGSVRYVLRTTFEVPQLARANRELADYRAFLIEAERQAKMASWHQTVEGDYRTIWSENVEAVIGYTAAQIHDDETFLSVIHPDDRERITRLFRAVDDTAQSYDAEYRVVRADGRTIWVRGITKVELDAAGEVVRYIGSIQDTTESKRAEQALRDSETLLKEAQRRAKLAYWLWEPGAGEYALAPECEQIIGVPLDILKTDADFLPFVHPEDRPWVAETYRRQMTLLEPYTVEYRWCRPDGKVIWLRDMCEQELDSIGRVRRLVGTIQDVTEQKRSEEALRENQAVLLAAQRRARIAYWLEDTRSGRAYTTSDYTAEVLGLPADAVPTTDGDFLKIVHPEDRARVAHAYERAVAANEPYALEYRIFLADGGIRWLRELAEFQAGPAGRPLRTIGTIQDITEQKSIETALRDSEARMRAFMDNAPIGMFVKDLDGRFTMLNRHDAEFFGRTPGELIGVRSVDLLASDDAAQIVAHERSVMAAGAPVERELHFANRPRIAWSYEVKFPIRDAGGAVVALGGVAVDISALKRAELALRESEARLRRAQLQAKLACWSWDLDTDSYAWAPGSGRALGLSDAALPAGNTDYGAIVHPEDRDALWRLYAEVEAGRDAFTAEFRILRPDGEVIWVEEIGEVERDAGGRRASASGTLQDVTERKQADAALRESEARLRGFLDHAPFAMYLKDTDLRYQLVNRAVEQFQGMTAAEICGRTPAQIYPPALAERFIAEDQEVLARGVPVTFEYSDPTLTSYADSLTVRFPVRDTNGRIVALGGITQDITERKQAERALRESEARMRSFMDNAPVAMAVKDLERRFVMANRHVVVPYGRTSEDVIGKRTIDIANSEGAKAIDALEREVIASGQTVTGEVHFVERSVSPWTFEVKFPIRDANGNLSAIGGIAIDTTVTKRSERALRESEARMRSFMDNAPVAVAIKDLERRFVLLNNRIELAFGRPAEEMIGRRTIELSSSEGAASVDALEREVVATGRAATAEVFFPERTALPWTFEVKFPIRDATGAMVAIGGVAIDISDRKKAELALAESEARFRSFMDNAPFDMIVKDLQGRYLMINRGVEAAWQRAGAEILGRSLPELSHSDGVAQVEAIEREVMETGHIVAREVHFTDLGPEWTYEVKFPIRDAAGRIVALGGVAIDVSDRKRAQMALAESEARLRRAQQQARLAYWSWQFATPQTAEEFRWSPGSGELLGMADAEMPKNDAQSMNLTIPEDRERLRRLYNEARAGLDNYTVEYRVRRSDGAAVWVREIAEVVRAADGRRVGVEGTMQDITDQRALEEQLRQAQKMESIGQLTGGIAHDFNNLMAVILGNLELLAEDLPGNAAAQQKIHTAIRSTLRGSDLTQRLLAFARQQSLAPKLTRIDDLIRAMRDLLLRPLGPAIEATFTLAGDRWPTEIDQARLETSLLNLVINARDAMPDGGKLTVATSNVTIEPGDARQIEGLAPGDYVLITVGDSGEGMTEEVRARAFDPFFTTKGVGKGTGLGLSMVYGFVKQSGGHVEIASEVGRGTTVTIYLPAAKGPTAAVAAADGARARETILIVGDDPAVLAMAGECLKDQGYTVIAAVDGPSALATIVQHDDIALLLTGVALAGPVDGAAVARQAAAMRPRLRVVFMSGPASGPIPPPGRPDTAWRRIDRPFRKVDLARVVREALDDRGGP